MRIAYLLLALSLAAPAHAETTKFNPFTGKPDYVGLAENGDGSQLTGVLKTAHQRAFNVLDYGADGTGTTTTVASWMDPTHVTVSSAAGFRVGQEISVMRAGAVETTGDTNGTATISNIADTSSFQVGQTVRVVGGIQAKAQIRTITVKGLGNSTTAGNTGDVFYAKINGVLYSYTLGQNSDPTTTAAAATGLAAAMSGASGVTVSSSTSGNDGVVTITAAVAGTQFSFENINPTGRGKVVHSTTQPNAQLGDWIASIVAVGASSITLDAAGLDDSASVTHHMSLLGTATGLRIEHEPSRLSTVVDGVNGNTLTLHDAAAQQVSGAAVYHNDQPAFTDAAAAATSNNGYVYAPAGTYYLGDFSTLTLGSASLTGDGMGVTIIKGFDSARDLIKWADGADNVAARDFTIDGQGTPWRAKSGPNLLTFGANTTSYVSNVFIERVEMLNSSNKGLLVFNPRNVHVSESHTANTRGGIDFTLYDSGSKGAMDAYDVWVTNSVIERSGEIGLSVYGTGNNDSYGTGKFSRVHVLGNTFYDDYMVGVELYSNVFDSEIRDNKAYRCGYNSTFGDIKAHGAYTIKYSSGITVADNLARDSYMSYDFLGRTDSSSLGFSMSRKIKVHHNYAFDSYLQGISWDGDVDGLELDHNEVYGSTVSGIQVNASATGQVSASNVSISDNIVKDALIGIRIDKNVYGALIRRNTLANNNLYEQNVDKYSAVAVLPYNSAGDLVSGIVIDDNRFTDTRTTPLYAQMHAIYADSTVVPAGAVEAYKNYAAGLKTNNVYPALPNSAYTASKMNTWDAGGYQSPIPTVPYSGATGAVDLGAQNLTTTGTLTGGAGVLSATAPTLTAKAGTVVNGTEIFRMNFNGTDNAPTSNRPGPWISAAGRETWTASSRASRLLLGVVPTGSTSQTAYVYLDGLNGGVGVGANPSVVAPGATLEVANRTASTGATQLLVQGGAAANDATTNTLLRVNAGGGTTQVFGVTGAGNVAAAGAYVNPTINGGIYSQTTSTTIDTSAVSGASVSVSGAASLTITNVVSGRYFDFEVCSSGGGTISIATLTPTYVSGAPATIAAGKCSWFVGKGTGTNTAKVAAIKENY